MTRARCLIALTQAGDLGLTDFELGERVGRQQTSAGCRRNQLVKDGLVEYAGFTRPAPSGSPARVWRVIAVSALSTRGVPHPAQGKPPRVDNGQTEDTTRGEQ